MKLYSWTIGHELVAVHRERLAGVHLSLRNECDEKTPDLLPSHPKLSKRKERGTDVRSCVHRQSEVLPEEKNVTFKMTNLLQMDLTRNPYDVRTKSRLKEGGTM